MPRSLLWPSGPVTDLHWPSGPSPISSGHPARHRSLPARRSRCGPPHRPRSGRLARHLLADRL